MARVLDCRAVAESHWKWVASEIEGLRRKPVLSTILFQGEKNPASKQYRDLIVKDAGRLGVRMDSRDVEDEVGLLEILRAQGQDCSTTGLMLFYPLGARIKDEDVMDLVSPLKDVEGLHSTNLGYLIKYKRYLDADEKIKCVVPATAKAVVKILQAYPEINLSGAFVTIINNSMRVGKPLGLMFENLGATVVNCFDKTSPEALEQSVRRADIVVTAVPDPKFRVNPAWIKPGAAVVDVSYEGNLDAKAVGERAGFLTMPDNRIGSVTRAMTFVNLIYCAKNVPLRRNAPALG